MKEESQRRNDEEKMKLQSLQIWGRGEMKSENQRRKKEEQEEEINPTGSWATQLE